MMQTEKRGLYIELLCSTVLAGVLSFPAGRLLQRLFTGRPVLPLMIGICFALLTILTLLAIVLTERSFRRLGERVDRTALANGRQGVKMTTRLLLLSAAVIGAAAALLQFLYQLEWRHTAPEEPKQFVFLIDNSGSMSSNDPEDKRGDAFRALTEKLPKDIPIAAYSFDDGIVELHPLRCGNEIPFIEEMFRNTAGGGTDISKACRQALAAVSQGGNARTRIILLTDGYCKRLHNHPARVSRLVKELTEGNCEVFSVGLGSADEACLRALSEGTNGSYYPISDLAELSDAIEQAATEKAETLPRTLIGFRGGYAAASAGLGLFRILAITLLGGLLALASAMVLYFQVAFRPVLIGGIICSALAGVLTELLCQGGAVTAAQLLLFVLLSMVLLTCRYRTTQRGTGGGKLFSLTTGSRKNRSASGLGSSLGTGARREKGGEHRIE